MNVVLFDVTEDYIVGDGRRRQRRRLKHLIIRGDNVVLVARAHDGPTPRDAAAAPPAAPAGLLPRHKLSGKPN
jgi:hypothetical protein